MSHIFIGVDKKKGVVDQPATINAASQAKNIELNIDASVYTTRESVLVAIEMIELAVVQAPWPPI